METNAGKSTDVLADEDKKILSKFKVALNMFLVIKTTVSELPNMKPSEVKILIKGSCNAEKIACDALEEYKMNHKLSPHDDAIIAEGEKIIKEIGLNTDKLINLLTDTKAALVAQKVGTLLLLVKEYSRIRNEKLQREEELRSRLKGHPVAPSPSRADEDLDPLDSADPVNSSASVHSWLGQLQLAKKSSATNEPGNRR